MSTFYPWVMWFFAALFFAYQFIIRVFLGLCVPEIMHKFQIDATEFGFLSAMYYYGYAGMQIPLAFLLDRFGPRLIVSLCCFTCSAALFLFYWAESWYLVLFARFLIGVGSAAGFLGAFKIISLWFPFPTYARMFALTNTVGLLGAVYGGKPVSHLLVLYGWENVLLIIGTAGLLLTALIATIIKPYKLSSFYESPSFIKNFRALFSMPILFLIAFGSLLMVGPLEGFADVWGVSYLMEVYSLEKTDASFITSAIFTGMMVGGPLLAYVSEKLKAPTQTISLCGILIAALFAIMLLSNGGLSNKVLFLMMFAVGILCCYQVLIFSMGASLVSPKIRNVSIALLNCINMLGGIFFHTIIGALMDVFWTGGASGGQRVYEAISYEYAIWAIPSAAFSGGLLFLFLRPLGKPVSLRVVQSFQKS
ncbi:MAG: MFS transporter [Alphaproteobacteria bacterium]|nr:MFS transporter [Alphaproteobacteria bacterium]